MFSTKIVLKSVNIYILLSINGHEIITTKYKNNFKTNRIVVLKKNTVLTIIIKYKTYKMSFWGLGEGITIFARVYVEVDILGQFSHPKTSTYSVYSTALKYDA